MKKGLILLLTILKLLPLVKNKSIKKTSFLILSLFCLLTGTAKAQYTVLHSFNDTLGSGPFGSLTPSASGGILYGMTDFGGVDNIGFIFSMDTDGTRFTDLLDFNDTNGAYPSGTVTLSVSGKLLYGLTSGGGVHDSGCVFSIDTDGSNFKRLFDFGSIYGAHPYGNLTLLGNKLYGTTWEGGANGMGTVFSMDTDGTRFTVLLDFNGTNGSKPLCSLTLSADKSTLYGFTYAGGAFGLGLIFSIDTNGMRYRDLLNFNNTNGSRAYYGPLTLSTSGSVLYGMTSNGGIHGSGCIFSIDTDGTAYHDLLDFNGTNGDYPEGAVILSDSLLYGMSYDGAAGYGNVFAIDTDGSGFNSLLNFNYANGANPGGSLILIRGVWYGMTAGGGTNDDGVIFRYKLDTNRVTANKLIAKREKLTVYPNPSDGNFILYLSNINEKCNVEILNYLGEKVYSQLATFNSQLAIDLFSQPNGIYLYRVLKENGSLIASGKIVIGK